MPPNLDIQKPALVQVRLRERFGQVKLLWISSKHRELVEK